ncbi:MAG: hypothetical protein D6820_09555 [Lentisphaerae bacterium]|nr:MAG: hypothetical protein D6820_09555 [Lentisphaerota bacterium]
MEFLRRRRIGAAYERAPYERVFEWIKINTLRLIGAVVGFFAWCIAVIVAIKIINFVASEGGRENFYLDDTSGGAVIVKVVGGIIVSLVIILSSRR